MRLRTFSNRTALTLLELLVVLTILIALGGIVVASLPGLLTRTQAATGTANLTEIDRTIQRNLLINQGRIGNRFDSLVAGGSGGNGDVASYVGGQEKLVATSLSANEVRALAELGITELIPAAVDVDDATFDSHLQLPVPLSPESRVCQLSPDYAAVVVEQLWNIEPQQGVRYLLFGLGQKCSLVGGGLEAVFKDAPIHFSDNRLSNPKNMYSRYLVVIELQSVDKEQSRARYVGVAIPDPNGITGLAQQLKDFYSTQE